MDIQNRYTGGLIAMLIRRIEVPEECSPEEMGCILANEFHRMAERNLNILWFALDRYPDELMMLSQWMEPIIGLFPSDGQDWAEWIRDVRAIDEVFGGVIHEVGVFHG